MIVYFVSDATILVFTKYCGKYCIIFYSAAEPGVISSAKKKEINFLKVERKNHSVYNMNIILFAKQVT